MKKFLYISTALMLLLAGCEDAVYEAYSDYVEDVAIESIALSIDGTTEGDGYGESISKILSIHESFELKAMVYPSNAADKWYSWEVEQYDESGEPADDIISFDTSYGGTLTADKVGTAKITVSSTVDDSICATIEIISHDYVVESDITLSTESMSNYVAIGDILEVDLSVVEGKKYDSIVWSLDNASAAIYGSTSGKSVKVVGAATGDVTLSVMFVRGDEFEPLVIDFPLSVVAEYVAVEEMKIYYNGVELLESEPLQMWVGEEFTLDAVVTPDNSIIKSYKWSIVEGGNISCVATESGNCVVTATNMGSYGSITVTSDCVATGEYISKTISVNVNATPTVGFYYYSDYTYSEKLDSTREVLGFIYSVDADQKRAYVVSCETPYSPTGTTGVSWVSSSDQFATTYLSVDYEIDNIFVWTTNNEVDDGIYNMKVVQYYDETYESFPAFQAVHQLNANYSSIYYPDITSSGNDNIWYLPTGAQLAVACAWIYQVSGGDYTAANALFKEAGRGSALDDAYTAREFTVFTGSATRLYPSYDNNGNGGDKIAIYAPYNNTNTYYTTNQYKVNAGWTAPVLHFSYGD